MDKRNKTALAYLLIGVAAAGRCLLAVPENAALQEISLTVLAIVGYLLLASRDKRPVLLGGAGLVLELLLCGGQTGGVWVWLSPALRALDLWLFWPRRCCCCALPIVPAAGCPISPLCRWQSTPSPISFRRWPRWLQWPLWRSAC